MNSTTVELVQSSWAKVVPIEATAADLFYSKLFELDPNVKMLFPDDLTAQKRKLMQTLSVAIKGLSDVGSLVPVLQALGKRHVDYGVSDEHYDTVGAALLWTLGQGLGDAFTAEVKAAWTEVYGVVASTMKAAAADVSTDTSVALA